jgi:hypothetical protein
MINQLALTDDVEGLWSVESRNPSSAKAFLHDQDPERSLVRSDLARLLNFGKYCGALQNAEQCAFVPLR